jgi:UDP-sulfoquinovose synthase
VELAMNNPPAKGKLQILNQFTEMFTVNQLAEKIQRVGNGMGLNVQVSHIDNPRKELEDHYYNAKHHGLLGMGLKPHHFTDEVAADLLERVIKHKSMIDTRKIMPRIRWKQ